MNGIFAFTISLSVQQVDIADKMILKPTFKGCAAVLLIMQFVLLTGCGRNQSTGESGKNEPPVHDLVPVHDNADRISGDGRAKLSEEIIGLTQSPPAEGLSSITIDYPLNGSVFPIDFTQPTFLWHDSNDETDQWLITFHFEGDRNDDLSLITPGGPPSLGEIDMEAVSETNEIYEGTEYQRSAESWTPDPELWEVIKRRSLDMGASVTLRGLSSKHLGEVLSAGSVQIKTSGDPVGAPIFYRDVPLMPAKTEPGKIRPLGTKAIPIIAWRLRDVSKPDSKLVLKGMHSCANCHSFSADGKTLGMDMDGPDGDKGMYTIKDIGEKMVIGKQDVITWNSFPEKPENHRTLGLFSRVSPDGRFVASTVNEKIFIRNFDDHKILQVFYPTRGIIGIYSRDRKEFSKLPGADDPDYVQCNPVWSPDGKWIYFSRAKAFDPYFPGQVLPEYPNDPNEPQIKFDIYRVPFNDGKGGLAEPVAGASDNGYSNTFPKISPDGKWLVWTRCKNGMLLRPDGRLFIVPADGGKPREMNCNTPLMNSWHSFSPNGRWMVFSSKSRTPYTQAFLTHIDENGNDSPAILVPNCTAANRAVNLPEFLNAGYDDLDMIEAPVVAHHVHMMEGERRVHANDYRAAADSYAKALENEPTLVRALVNMGAALGKIGHPEQGLIYIERALEAHPEDPYCLLNSALLYLDSDRLHMADKNLSKLEESAPYFPKIKQTRMLVDSELEKLSAEISRVQEALIAEPENPGIHQVLAELHRRAGRLEKSIEHLERVYVLSKRNPVIGCNLAWTLATNPDDSIRNGKRAQELARLAVDATGGQRPEPWDVLAAACAELGEFEKAQAAHERAEKLAKDVNPGLLNEWSLRRRLFPTGRAIRSPRDR